MKILNEYLEKQKELFDYFGYVEDWVVIPVEDATRYFWIIDGNETDGVVRFADTEENLNNYEAGEFYENSIWSQRFLPKWVYVGEEYTMICVDTHTDGNKFLQIFDNSKRLK